MLKQKNVVVAVYLNILNKVNNNYRHITSLSRSCVLIKFVSSFALPMSNSLAV